MKNLIYTFAFLSLMTGVFSCGKNDSGLDSDYTDLNVPGDKIDGLIAGQWKKYTGTRTHYANGKETVEQLGSYAGNFRFEVPQGNWLNFNSYDFPYSGMFEVRRYGERMTFYQRSTDQHTTLMLEEVTSTKVVFKQSYMANKDYFVVTRYTLTK